MHWSSRAGEQPLRTIIVRRLKGRTDSIHYLERDEMNGLKLLHRQQQADEIKGAYVFINERGQPFGRMGIGRMIERAGEAAGLPFPVHVHMLRHSTGYALAARGMDTRRLQHFLGHASITNTVRYTAMSPEPFKDIWRWFQRVTADLRPCDVLLGVRDPSGAIAQVIDEPRHGNKINHTGEGHRQ
jgi:site-specific recombinase XerD